MPENKVTPATEPKKPDPTVKAPGAAPTTEQKTPAPNQPSKANTPTEKTKEPPKTPPTPSPLPPKQTENKGKAVAEPKKEDSLKASSHTVQKKPEEKKPEVKAADPKPKAATEPKKTDEATKQPTTAEQKKNEPIPLSADPKQPEAVPKKEPPKPEEAKIPITVSGKDKVEIPMDPKPAAKEDVPNTPEPAASPAQEAEGPKGITITQVFADRLAPPLEADLRSLPIPKEGEAFSMRLHPAYFFEFLEHPFTINRETKDYKDLYESIKENGIRDPVYCRPREKGGLEIISGHRRHDIGTQLNYPIPTIIVQADDDTARIAVVDGNLHRMDIPTSELARAAKMKMEALTRKAGRRSKMEQLSAPQKRSDQQVAEDMGMSRNQVQRLVRIDALVPELKQQVDDKTLPFNTAVELSYMKPDEQKKVVDFMAREQITPSIAQATQLKEASKHAETLAKHVPSLAPANAVDEKKIASIIKPKKEPDLKVVLTAEELRSYFPEKLPTVVEAKRAIFDALDLRKKALEKQAQKKDIMNPAR